MATTNDFQEELVGLERLHSLVDTWGVDTATFEPPHPSDDNPFRVLPKGIHFEGYHHDTTCPQCGGHGTDRGVLSNYTGMIGGGYMTVYYCQSDLSVWLKSFGWSEQRDYPENHVFHPDNR